MCSVDSVGKGCGDGVWRGYCGAVVRRVGAIQGLGKKPSKCTNQGILGYIRIILKIGVLGPIRP